MKLQSLLTKKTIFMKCQSLYSAKKNTTLSSTEFTKRVVKIKSGLSAYRAMQTKFSLEIQSTLDISTSLISINRLSRSENLVPV